MKLSEIKKIIRKIIKEKTGEYFKIEIDEPRIKNIDADLSFPAFEILKKDKNKLQIIIEELKGTGFFEKIENVSGFVNLKVRDEILVNSLELIYRDVSGYFREEKKDKKVLVEYISANPTGPLNVANARAACIGDLLVEAFNISGFEAHSEYYYNNSGRQVELLGISLRERVKELKGENFEIPEDGYHGEYLKDIAEDYIKEKSNEDYVIYALKKMIEKQKKSLKRFGTEFDNFVYESDIRKSSLIEETLKKLEKYIYKKEGALFFKSTEFGDEKDRVLVKSNGEYTYFLVDIAYHLHKIKRGYDFLLNLWGPDHHGYIPRMKGALKALSFEKFDVLIVQQVNLKRGKERVRMSKRRGEIYSLDDLIDEVGKDAARFFLLLRAPSSPLDFDLELAKKMSQENPLYYVQYAHARCNQIMEFAKKKGFSEINIPEKIILDGRERGVVKKMSLIQDIYDRIRKSYMTHLLPTKLMELVSVFHSFYQAERVVDENNKENTIKRLFIVNTLKNLLKFTLDSMKINAPEKM